MEKEEEKPSQKPRHLKTQHLKLKIKKLKISIITATLNNRDTVEDCLNSIHDHSYKDIEHIVIDGGSTDGTIDLLSKYKDSIAVQVSEPDNGIYHALNKGIKLASGDIIGFLHADDYYADSNVIEKVVSQMAENNVDSCYGDLDYVSRKNTGKTLRRWKSCPYEESLFEKGWMPPHPTFFVKKEIYDNYGVFDTDFRIAADYELMLRFLQVNKVSTHYIPDVLVKMRSGGESNRNIKNIMKKTYEDYRARKINNLKGNYQAIILKNLSKIPQFFRR